MTIVLDGSKGISIPDGTVAEPSIRGVNSNTGIFYVNNDISFASDGTERLRIFANGSIVVNGAITANGSTITLGAGTVSAPSLTVQGDPNTGMFFPAADTIAFTEGGVEAMRLDSSGNVGIGTSSPTAKLHVVGNATFSATVQVSTLSLTNALSVAAGGTGANTLTAENVLLGNGTGALKTVAPGTNGNILTSNGTTWISQAAGGVTLVATLSPANGATSITVTDISPYKILMLVSSGVTFSTSSVVRFSLSSDNGTSFGEARSASSSSGTGFVTLYRANESSANKPYYAIFASNSMEVFNTTDVTGVINSIRFNSNSGTFAGAGNILIYGIN